MITGLDVSSYQSPADWKALHPGFVFAKASEGHTTRDASFSAHISQARDKGAVVGAYHFGWPTNDVHEEADNYLGAVVHQAGAGMLHALDLEPYPDRRNVGGMTAAAISDWASRWLARVKQTFPHQPVGVYADAARFAAGWVPRGADFYWVADYPRPSMSYSDAQSGGWWPATGHGYPSAAFWQFTDTPLDMDLGSFTDVAHLRSWMGAPAPVHQPQGGRYTVQSGDTLSGIAERSHVSLAALEAANPQIKDPDFITVGEVIDLPASKATTYTVQAGDTLSAIAERFRVSLGALEGANSWIRDPDVIYPGWHLTIPTGS